MSKNNHTLNYLLLICFIKGFIDKQSLQINQYLQYENSILKKRVKKIELNLTSYEKRNLAKFAFPIPKYIKQDMSFLASPIQLENWYRELIKKAWDFSKLKKKRKGRKPFNKDIQQLVIDIAIDNEDWGYRRIQGTLNNLGYTISHQTVGNILKTHGIPPAPNRSKTKTWDKFFKEHFDILHATDFFTYDILSIEGKAIPVYVLFFIHIKTREVTLGGVTTNPDAQFMRQIGRNITDCYDPLLKKGEYLIHDGDKKYLPLIDFLKNEKIKCKQIPPKSPNLNAYAERFVRSIKDECLNKFILLNVHSVRYVCEKYFNFHKHERNHQGKDNKIPIPYQDFKSVPTNSPIQTNECLPGLRYYYRIA